MKKKVIAAISLAILLSTVGCNANKEDDFEIIGGADGPTSIFLASLVGGEEQNDIFSGTWQTASMGYEFYGKEQPMYYVQFKGTEIHYGHMQGEEISLDHIDEISYFDEYEAGSYIVKAQTESGAKYMYRTLDSDKGVLEYFDTWDDEGYWDKYSAGASLFRYNS